MKNKWKDKFSTSNKVTLHNYQKCRASRMNSEYFEFWKTKKFKLKNKSKVVEYCSNDYKKISAESYEYICKINIPLL